MNLDRGWDQSTKGKRGELAQYLIRAAQCERPEVNSLLEDENSNENTYYISVSDYCTCQQRRMMVFTTTVSRSHHGNPSVKLLRRIVRYESEHIGLVQGAL